MRFKKTTQRKPDMTLSFLSQPVTLLLETDAGPSLGKVQGRAQISYSSRSYGFIYDLELYPVQQHDMQRSINAFLFSIV